MKKTKNIPSWLTKVMNHYITHNLLIFFGLCIVLYISALVGLRYYTHHGEQLPVPNLKGMTVQEALATLEKADLRGKVSDSTWVASAKRGTVVSQLPEAGSNVKESRTIYFVINAVSPEMVKMPDVVGVSLRQAVSALEALGLKVGKKIYIPDIARDNVLRQTYRGKDIIKGAKVVKGAAIDLYLGSGYDE